MSFDKTIAARLFGVTTQNTDVRLPLAGDSSGGTFTGKANPLRGTLVWDRAMYVLKKVAVAGGATGGSYTVTIETDAVKGYTGLPIARVTLGPNSATTVVMDNLHQSPGSPLPTHVFVDQTSTGGGLTCECHVLAKKYRGVLGTPGSNTSERVLQGTMVRGATTTGGYFTDSKGWDASGTFIVGTSATNLGMNRMRLWDSAFFWSVAGNTIDGTGDVDIISTVDGTTVSIATTGIGGAVSAAGEKNALASNFYGQCPNPSQIIWTEVGAGAGVSDPRIVMLAKSGRGSMAKT